MSIIGGRYKVGKKIAQGSYGEVYYGLFSLYNYIGTDTETGKSVAIKMERVNAKYPQLEAEAQVLPLFQHESMPLKGSKMLLVGFPRVYWTGEEGDRFTIVMEYLGPNLETLFQYCGRKFSHKTCLLLAKQLISRLETIHNNHYIHRDVKPENFLIGLREGATTVFMVDFGLSKMYRHPRTFSHVPYRSDQTMVGTTRYASINAHLGVEQSRRDDLMSFMYILCYLARGSLPWQGIKVKDKNEKYQTILKLKTDAKQETLCKGLPKAYLYLFKEIKKLRFDQDPDYTLYNKILDKAFKAHGLHEDDDFDWLHISYEDAISSKFLKRLDARNVYRKIHGIAALKNAEKEPIKLMGYHKSGSAETQAIHLSSIELSAPSTPTKCEKAVPRERRKSSIELNKISSLKGEHRKRHKTKKEIKGCGCVLL